MAKTSKKFRDVMTSVMFNEIGNSKNGGLVNDPADRGGLTKWGISSKKFKNIDIASLTKKQAEDIYWDKYWSKIKGEELHILSGTVMDMAVNAGVDNASKLLQQILGVKTDGIIGAQTVKALWEHPDKQVLLERYTILRVKHYISLCRTDHSQDKFLYGWINRTQKWVSII